MKIQIYELEGCKRVEITRNRMGEKERNASSQDPVSAIRGVIGYCHIYVLKVTLMGKPCHPVECYLFYNRLFVHLTTRVMSK